MSIHRQCVLFCDDVVSHEGDDQRPVYFAPVRVAICAVVVFRHIYVNILTAQPTHSPGELSCTELRPQCEIRRTIQRQAIDCSECKPRPSSTRLCYDRRGRRSIASSVSARICQLLLIIIGDPIDCLRCWRFLVQ